MNKNILRENWEYEYDAVRATLVMHRTMAYRHALKHAGYCEQSIELAIKTNQDWIKSGDWTGEPKR